jgi:tetratricopeptide (TPR) repeat protein
MSNTGDIIMLRIVAVIIIWAIGTTSGYGAQNNIGAGETAKPFGVVAPVRSDNPNRYQTESEWIVGAVATDIAEMVAVALKKPVPSLEVRTREAGKYTITVKSWGGGEITSEVELAAKYAWSPDAFKPFALALLGNNAGKAKSETTDNSLPAALLDPTPEVIIREDLRVSNALGKDLLSPDNHDQAALVISALVLRESAESFSDIRHLLCRLSAHLAISRSLRPEGAVSSTSGLWAEATLLTLVGRASEALSIADKMKSGSTDERWRNALAIRNTGDWRNFRKTQTTSLLELREWFRASIERRGTLATLEPLEDSKLPNVADWSRLMLSHHYPVDIANSVAPEAVKTEVVETARVYKAYTGSDLTSEQWISELNGTGNRCIRTAEGKPITTVLGWANWSPFLRRHLLMALFEEIYAMNRMLGLKEDARNAASQQDKSFAGLQDYWQVRVLRSNTEHPDKSAVPLVASSDFKSICTQASVSLRERAESVPMTFWVSIYNKCISERTRGVISGPETWFSPVLPAGTIFNLDEVLQTNLWSRLTLADYEKMHILKPGDYSVAYKIAMMRFGNQPTPANAENVFGPLLDYDDRAMSQVISFAENSGGDAGKYHERVCEMNADKCIGAGDYFAARGDNIRAIKAFERGLEKARDPLPVANEADWPVDYYLDSGRQADALRFAKYAADVYSGNGLKTMGRYMERLGKYNDAASWYRKIKERYDNDSVIKAFYIRYHQRIGDERFAEESVAAFRKIFPNGLEKVTFSDFNNPPNYDDGFKVTARIMFQRNKKIGLHPGDVVVAIDGYHVHNADQWETIRSFRDDPTISLIIWRGNRYQQLIGPYVRDKFGPPAKPTP